MSNIDWSQTEALLEKNIRFIENSTKMHTDVNRLRQLNEEDYRILACEDGKGFTIEKKTEKGFVRMHSAYEPYREGKLLAEQLMTEENKGKTIVRFGLGFGYMFHYLVPFAEEHGCEIVIYEPSYDVFSYFIRLFDISKLFKGVPVRLFVSDGTDDIHKIFPYVKGVSLASTNSYYTIGYRRFFDDEIDVCVDGIKYFFHTGEIARNTMDYFSITWIKKNISNLPHIFKGYTVESLEGILNGKPAVLVAAGPSLDKNVHLLKELEGKVLIAAVYSTFKTLEAHNITPDFFTVVDANQPIYPHNESYAFADMNLAAHPVVNEKMYDTHNKNNFFFFADDGAPQNDFVRIVMANIGRKLRSFGTFGGSVAHMTAATLRYMGAGTIVMIGQDLAFPDGKQTHAKDAFEGLDIDKAAVEEWSQRTKRIQVEDIYGNMVETDTVLSSFIDSYEEFAEMHMDTLEIVDATEGGAKIKHTKIMTFREAIDTYMTEYTDPAFTSELIKQAKVNGAAFSEDEKPKVLKILDKLLVESNNILGLTDNAMEKAEKVLKLFRFNKIPTRKELNKPFAAFKKCVDEIIKNKLAYDLLAPTWIAKIEEDKAFRRDEECEELFWTRGMHYVLYAQKEGCIVLSETIEETLGKLRGEQL